MQWQLQLQTQEAVMRMFDVHELEDRITEVLQSVQETGETVAVTKGGEIIAHLVAEAFAEETAGETEEIVGDSFLS
jgi:antitoxin (DNA-binding transcriptional repressor) of toxin-antitoxin stability system